MALETVKDSLAAFVRLQQGVGHHLTSRHFATAAVKVRPQVLRLRPGVWPQLKNLA